MSLRRKALNGGGNRVIPYAFIRTVRINCLRVVGELFGEQQKRYVPAEMGNSFD